MTKFHFLIAAALLISALKTIQTTESNDTRQPLYVIASGPYPDLLEGDSAWPGGIPLVSAVRLAFKHINSNSAILQDYRLEALEDDSGCRLPSKALLSFHHKNFYSGKKVVGIVGPGCSGSTLLVAPLLSRSSVSIIQIAPSATSPAIQALNESTTFTMITPLSMVGAFVATMKNNNWKQLTIVYDANRLLFTEFQAEVSKQILLEEDMKIVNSLIFLDGDTEAERFYRVDDVRQGHSRVVLLLMEPVSAVRFLCVAYNKGLYYPRYQWVLLEKSYGEFVERLEKFAYNGRQYECTTEQLAVAANGAIISQFQLKQANDTVITPNNIAFHDYRKQLTVEFKKHFDEERVQRAVHSTESIYVLSQLTPKNNWENLYYDAAWAMGIALDAAAKRGVNLSEYKYGQPNTTQILIEELLNVDFEGSVGPVKFSEDRTVRSPIVVSQLWRNNYSKGLRETVVALFVRNRLYYLNNETDFSYISDTFGEMEDRVHYSVGIILNLITLAITLVTALLQIAFLHWFKRKSIRATSPEISHLIFSGCYLFSIATILFTCQQTLSFDSTILKLQYSIICNLITWCLLLGFSLIFGTVFAKVWRVFKLFRHFRNERPGIFLSDQSLVAAVTVLVIIDCVICIIWNAYDPWMLSKTFGEIHDIGDEQIVVAHLTCSCNYDIYWIAVIAAYKGVIALLLVIFSVLNRKIHRKHFSHTKKINVFVYSLTVLGGIGFPLYFLLRGVTIYASFFIFSTVLLATIVMCCVMLFLPPIWPIIRHKIDISKFSSSTVPARPLLWSSS